MSDSIETRLSEDGYYVCTTVGVSMKPMLRNRRDRVVILPVGGTPLCKWDLPLYRTSDGRYLLHRIIGIREDGTYIVRGDNTYHLEYVPHDAIVGVMSEFYRGQRHILASNKRYRRYAAFWNAIYPVRRFCRTPLFWWHALQRKCKKKKDVPSKN